MFLLFFCLFFLVQIIPQRIQIVRAHIACKREWYETGEKIQMNYSRFVETIKAF